MIQKARLEPRRSSKPLLLVEDDHSDAMSVRKAILKLKIRNELVHATDSEEALGYLRNNTYKKPCLIILDLNMPQTDSIEFLKAVEADEALKTIPVVVLVTSNKEQDVIESHKLSIADYIVKPFDYRKFMETIRTINLYWTLSEFSDGR